MRRWCAPRLGITVTLPVFLVLAALSRRRRGRNARHDPRRQPRCRISLAAKSSSGSRSQTASLKCDSVPLIVYFIHLETHDPVADMPYQEDATEGQNDYTREQESTSTEVVYVIAGTSVIFYVDRYQRLRKSMVVNHDEDRAAMQLRDESGCAAAANCPPIMTSPRLVVCAGDTSGTGLDDGAAS